jgi:uncharacterized protein (DUF1778 family)
MDRSKQSKMGRPRLPRERVKSTPVLIRVTWDFRKALEKAAKARGMTMAAFIRATLEKAIEE